MELGIEGLGDATQIGCGGSAVVYRSQQTTLRRDVAVKVLTNVDPAFVRRFEREARTLGKLSQKPGIVTVHDAGLTANGQPYLVLELCPTSLQDRLSNSGPLSPPVACELLATIARAVAAAHDLGVVHRDLKPANILMSPDDEPLVADFGIAVASGLTLDQTNSVAFSEGYVAPETIAGTPAEKPADVFALGAMLFYSVSGRLPFVDPTGSPQSLVALASRVMNDPVPNLRHHGIPDGVCRLIEWAMDKNPDKRPTAWQMEERLKALAASSRPVHGSNPAERPPPPPPSTPLTPPPSRARTPHPPTPHAPLPVNAPSHPPPGAPPPFQPNPSLGFGAGANPQVNDRGARRSAGADRPFEPAPFKPPRRRRRGPIDLLLAIIRGLIASFVVFVIGLTLFLVGLLRQSGTIDYNSQEPLLEAGGRLGLIGALTYTIGTVVAFFLGIWMLRWPKRRRVR